MSLYFIIKFLFDFFKRTYFIYIINLNNLSNNSELISDLKTKKGYSNISTHKIFFKLSNKDSYKYSILMALLFLLALFKGSIQEYSEFIYFNF